LYVATKTPSEVIQLWPKILQNAMNIFISQISARKTGEGQCILPDIDGNYPSLGSFELRLEIKYGSLERNEYSSLKEKLAK